MSDAEQAGMISSGNTSVFKNRNFLFLFTGAFFSAPGYYVYLIGVEWLMLSITGNRSLFGFLFLAASVPRLLFMTTGGIIADRFNKRTILFLSDLSRACLVGVILILVMNNQIAPWHLITFAALFGVSDAFSHPAVNSLTSTILEGEQLQKGNALIQMTNQISPILGPLAGGSFIWLVGFKGVFMLAGAMLLLSSLTVFQIRVNKTRETLNNSGAWSEFKEGIAYVRNHNFLASVMVMALFLNFFVTGPLSIGIPLMVKDVFHEDALGLTTLEVSLGAGALLGSILLASIGAIKKPGYLMLASITLFGGLYAISGLGIGLYINAGLFLCIGFLLQFVNVPLITMVQQTTDQAMIGRVLSLLMTVSTGLVPISYLVTSSLIAAGISIQFITITGGLVVAVIALLYFTNQKILNFSYE